MTIQVRPNFYLLGAPKCGTSAMRSYLAAHPQVFFASPDEPGYFDRRYRFSDMRQCAYRSVADYLTLYKDADPALHKAIGEGSVYMMYSAEILSEILCLSPDARFVLMIRNPYEAAISMHGENLKSASLGREPAECFADAWDDLGNRTVDEISGVHSFRFRYDQLFSYHRHVIAARDAVGEDRLMVIVYDEFKNDNLGVAQKLYRFLGVSDSFEPAVAVVNERSQARDSLFARAVFRAAKHARRSRLLRPLRGRGLTLNRFTQKSLPKPNVSKRLMDDMRRVYQSDIYALQRTLGCDLSGWLETDLSDRAS